MKLILSRVGVGVYFLVFVGVTLFELRDRGYFSRIIENSDAFDLGYLAFVLVSLLMGVLWVLYRRNKSYERLLYIIVLIGNVIILMFGAFFVVNAQGDYRPVALMVGANIALTGIFLQNLITLNNHRKQHTLNILLQMRQSDVFINHKAKLGSTFPPKTILNKERAEKLLADYEAGNDTSVVHSVIYVLNYYEFIAAGVVEGELDQTLVERTLKGMIQRLYTQLYAWIDLMRKNDDTNSPSKIYIELINLNQKWQTRKIEN